MKHIFGNYKKYWYIIIAVFALLIIQAFCDLSLPDYTSSIIDVGISNSGIEHEMPEYISESGMMKVLAFMNDEEKATFVECYVNQDGIYELKDKSTDNWDALDEKYITPLAVTYMISSAAQTGESANKEQMMSKMAEYNIDPTSPTLMLDIRKAVENQAEALGSMMTSSSAKAFAKEQYVECGKDINKLQTDYLWKRGGRMLVMAFVMALCAIAVGFLASRVGAGIGRDLRSRVFNKVISFSDAELDSFSTASLITRSTNDVQQVQIVSVLLLRMVLYSPILAIGGIINIQQYKSGMSWIIVLAVVSVMSIIMILLSFTMPKFKIMQDLVDNVNLVSREILTGLSVIRAFSREKKEEERFDEANNNLTKVMLFTNRMMAVLMPTITIIMNGVSVLIVWVASKKIDAGVLQVGAMTAFMTYSMLIIMSFLMLTMLSIMLPRAGVAADRIHEVLVSKTIITDCENPITDDNYDATVKFDHVNFKYPDGEEDVLSDITFEAKPGQTTAIIGSTGCGKSTLVKLILRFFDVSDGSISIGGNDIRKIALKTLRNQIGYVPQKAVLFSGDIESNIKYGTSDLSDENMIESATIAQAKEFIEEKKDKYKSEISQGGTNVSGGQKQRLSIARAIARNPKIYIFDDSFSALDFKTDTALRKALLNKTKDATVIIVAQRVSTILNADQILVLEDGKLVGTGTHRELVESCETYKQIAQSQLSEKEFNLSIGKEGL